MRKFLHKEMKISKTHLDEIEFERVHRIPTRIREKRIKQQIKLHVKHLPRGKSFGVADGFPKEVDEIRKEFYRVSRICQSRALDGLRDCSFCMREGGLVGFFLVGALEKHWLERGGSRKERGASDEKNRLKII